MTRRLQRGDRLVVASHNPGKVWEINQLIAPYGLDAVSAGALGLAVPEEPEPTFEGNAKIKALFAAKGSGLPALADDSGHRDRRARWGAWRAHGRLGRPEAGLHDCHATGT